MIYFTQWIIVRMNDCMDTDDFLDVKIVHVLNDDSFIRVQKQFTSWVAAHKEEGYVYRLYGGIVPALPRRVSLPATEAERRRREYLQRERERSNTPAASSDTSAPGGSWALGDAAESEAPPVHGGGGTFDGGGASGDWDAPPSSSDSSYSSDSGSSSSDSSSSDSSSSSD